MVDESALQQLVDAGSDELGRLLLRAVRAVNEQIISRLVALGHPDIRGPHTAVFANLDSDGTRAVILAQRAGMTRQSMSNLIRELETAGYVDLQPDPGDGRAALVRLTPRGEQFCLDAAHVINEVEAEWAERLGDPHLKHLRRSLHTLIDDASVRSIVQQVRDSCAHTRLLVGLLGPDVDARTPQGVGQRFFARHRRWSRRRR
jgi:DNA-binding MarR family transcriptional regulator